MNGVQSESDSSFMVIKKKKPCDLSVNTFPKNQATSHKFRNYVSQIQSFVLFIVARAHKLIMSHTERTSNVLANNSIHLSEQLRWDGILHLPQFHNSVHLRRAQIPMTHCDNWQYTEGWVPNWLLSKCIKLFWLLCVQSGMASASLFFCSRFLLPRF